MERLFSSHRDVEADGQSCLTAFRTHGNNSSRRQRRHVNHGNGSVVITTTAVLRKKSVTVCPITLQTLGETPTIHTSKEHSPAMPGPLPTSPAGVDHHTIRYPSRIQGRAGRRGRARRRPPQTPRPAAPRIQSSDLLQCKAWPR